MSLEELSPEELKRVELDVLERLLFRAQGGNQEHVPELAVLRPARASVTRMTVEDALEIGGREVTHDTRHFGGNSEWETEGTGHHPRLAPGLHQHLAKGHGEGANRSGISREVGVLIPNFCPPERVLKLEVEQEYGTARRATACRLVHSCPEFPRSKSCGWNLCGRAFARKPCQESYALIIQAVHRFQHPHTGPPNPP
jgi:hypothetical protein